MRRIDHYLSTTLIQTIALVLLFLVGFSLFIAFINEARDLGKGDYDIFEAIRYVILALPDNIYRLFPSAGLLGCLLGLGMLAHHGELTAMRSGGVSVFQISKTVMRIALLLTLLVTGFAEWLNPTALHFAQTQKTLAKSGGQALATSHGLWIKEGNIFIHIKNVIDSQHLQGMSIYEFDKQFRLTSALSAQDAMYQHDHWQLMNVKRSVITPDHVSSETKPSESWFVELDPTILKVATVDPQEMSLVKLHIYLNYLKDNGVNNNFYKLIFWQRVLQPLATIVMIMLAIPFIFGPLRSVTLGLRIVTGICIGFGFYLLNSFFGPMAVIYRFPPFLASFLPILIFATIGLIMVRKI